MSIIISTSKVNNKGVIMDDYEFENTDPGQVAHTTAWAAHPAGEVAPEALEPGALESGTPEPAAAESWVPPTVTELREQRLDQFRRQGLQKDDPLAACLDCQTADLMVLAG